MIFLTSCSIWIANSLVGDKTRQFGPTRLSLGVIWLSIWIRAGNKNANVLPVPVCAIPTQSSPFSKIGQSCDWTGEGLTNFWIRHCSSISGKRLNACSIVFTGLGIIWNK